MKNLILVGVLTLMAFCAKAQDEATFSDEELGVYASVMVWAELEKVKMGDSVEVWVKSNDMLSASMYNDLSKADKAGNIESVSASADELAVYNQIKTDIEAQKESFKEVYIGKIKEEIGAGLYNSLKKALRSDEELKTRYEVIYNDLLTASNTEAEVPNP